MTREFNIQSEQELFSIEREVSVFIGGSIEGTATWDGSPGSGERYLSDEEYSAAEASATEYSKDAFGSLKDKCAPLLGEGTCNATLGMTEINEGDGSVDLTFKTRISCKLYAEAKWGDLSCAIDEIKDNPEPLSDSK